MARQSPSRMFTSKKTLYSQVQCNKYLLFFAALLHVERIIYSHIEPK